MNFDKDIFINHLAPTSPFPLAIPIERASGSYLYTPEGEKYLDMIAGISVNNIGHRHPKVIQAIKNQIDKHLHVMVYGEFIQSTPNLLAQKLVSLLPENLDCCYFVNSGTEANEGALKLAKRATGRNLIISFHGSYHGSTHGSLSVSGNLEKRTAFRPLLPNIQFIKFDNEAELNSITEEVACVIVETIQGDAGVRIPSMPFMQALRKKCTEVGALLILDEIQCGMGRTGKLFAFEYFGIVPDILTLAKAFGGGLPLGAFISSNEIMKLLSHNPILGHITTFGGNPVSCATALATLQVIEEESVLDKIEKKSLRIAKHLKHAKILEMRRIGLMFALDFDTSNRVDSIVQYCLNHGVIVYWFLSNPKSLRLAPPLTISEQEIDLACEVILQAIDLS